MKGILFKENLFNKILTGEKTQTRRVIKGTPWDLQKMNEWEEWPKEEISAPKPRYKVGEVVYLKEPYIEFGTMDDQQQPVGGFLYKFDGKPLPSDLGERWSNKLFMPSRAARHFIKITGVRTERLQEITDSDILAEGVNPSKYLELWHVWEKLWDSINARPKGVQVKQKDGTKKTEYYLSFPWAGPDKPTTANNLPHYCFPNPWVWVYEFELVE